MSIPALPSASRLRDVAHPVIAGLISVIVNYGGGVSGHGAGDHAL